MQANFIVNYHYLANNIVNSHINQFCTQKLMPEVYIVWLYA